MPHYDAYTPEQKEMIFTAVTDLMRQGHTARKACRQVGIEIANIYDWCDENKEYSERYAMARRYLMQHWAEDIVEISDTPESGVITKESHLGFERTTKDAIEHRKLRVESRKWLLAKLHPSYGEKLALGGAPDLPPIKSETTVTLTPEEAYKQMLDGKARDT